DAPNHHSAAGCQRTWPVAVGSVSKPSSIASHRSGRADSAAFLTSTVASSVSLLAVIEAPVVYDGPQTIGIQSGWLSTTLRRFANTARFGGAAWSVIGSTSE